MINKRKTTFIYFKAEDKSSTGFFLLYISESYITILESKKSEILKDIIVFHNERHARNFLDANAVL